MEMSEQRIRQEVKEAKRPRTKTYLIVLVLVAAAVVFYMFYSASQGGTFCCFPGSTEVNNPNDAQRTSGDINTGVQDASSALDDISGILGI